MAGVVVVVSFRRITVPGPREAPVEVEVGEVVFVVVVVVVVVIVGVDMMGWTTIGWTVAGGNAKEVFATTVGGTFEP